MESATRRRYVADVDGGAGGSQVNTGRGCEGGLRGRAEEKGWGMIKKINTNGLMPLVRLGRLSLLNADVKDRRLNIEHCPSSTRFSDTDNCGGALDRRCICCTKLMIL